MTQKIGNIGPKKPVWGELIQQLVRTFHTHSGRSIRLVGWCVRSFSSRRAVLMRSLKSWQRQSIHVHDACEVSSSHSLQTLQASGLSKYLSMFPASSCFQLVL